VGPLGKRNSSCAWKSLPRLLLFC